nr:verprolin-like [Aegilops tauschii subsp. strangulata]
MRSEFALPELERLSSHLFAWHWLPSNGTTCHSGGILLGVKDATFEVGSMDRGELFVSMEIFECSLNFKWEIVIVYGPADHRRSKAFLDELRRKVLAAQLPVVVGGDKSNSLVNLPRMQMFNDCIADLGLRELDRVGSSKIAPATTGHVHRRRTLQPPPPAANLRAPCGGPVAHTPPARSARGGPSRPASPPPAVPRSVSSGDPAPRRPQLLPIAIRPRHRPGEPAPAPPVPPAPVAGPAARTPPLRPPSAPTSPELSVAVSLLSKLRPASSVSGEPDEP